MHNLCKSNCVTALFYWVSFVRLLSEQNPQQGKEIEGLCLKSRKRFWKGLKRLAEWWFPWKIVKLRSQHTVKTLSDGCLESFYQMLRQAQAASLATAPCQIQCECCSNLPKPKTRECPSKLKICETTDRQICMPLKSPDYAAWQAKRRSKSSETTMADYLHPAAALWARQRCMFELITWPHASWCKSWHVTLSSNLHRSMSIDSEIRMSWLSAPAR